MEKKRYVTPQMECELMENVVPLCNSRVGGSGAGVNAGYGGVDTSGEIVPSIRAYDDDEEEEDILW